jgi:hypothetical protein
MEIFCNGDFGTDQIRILPACKSAMHIIDDKA